jgi:ribose 5-phosphate isomerase B
MRIAIGADHAGFALKQHLIGTLTRLGHDVDDRGIVIGGSGQGEQMAANKVPGIRAALCNELYTARLSRQHNDANVLAIGGRIVAPGLADEIVALWLDTSFEGGRHQRRVEQIAALEKHRDARV